MILMEAREAIKRILQRNVWPKKEDEVIRNLLVDMGLIEVLASPCTRFFELEQFKREEKDIGEPNIKEMVVFCLVGINDRVFQLEGAEKQKVQAVLYGLGVFLLREYWKLLQFDLPQMLDEVEEAILDCSHQYGYKSDELIQGLGIAELRKIYPVTIRKGTKIVQQRRVGKLKTAIAFVFGIKDSVSDAAKAKLIEMGLVSPLSDLIQMLRRGIVPEKSNRIKWKNEKKYIENLLHWVQVGYERGYIQTQGGKGYWGCVNDFFMRENGDDCYKRPRKEFVKLKQDKDRFSARKGLSDEVWDLMGRDVEKPDARNRPRK